MTAPLPQFQRPEGVPEDAIPVAMTLDVPMLRRMGHCVSEVEWDDQTTALRISPRHRASLKYAPGVKEHRDGSRTIYTPHLCLDCGALLYRAHPGPNARNGARLLNGERREVDTGEPVKERRRPAQRAWNTLGLIGALKRGEEILDAGDPRFVS